MRFKIDENLHDDVATVLSAAGHDAHTVHVEGLQSCSDVVLAERCQQENRAMITLDLDFADIRTYPPADYSGLIVLRLSNQSRSHVLQVVSQLIETLKTNELSGRLWIVSESGVRIRE